MTILICIETSHNLCSVMVNVDALLVLFCLGQSKNYKISICCLLLSTRYSGIRTKADWLRVRKSLSEWIDVYLLTFVSVTRDNNNSAKPFGLVKKRHHLIRK